MARLTFWLVFLYFGLSYAGVSSSGGGGAIVCYKDQQIVSAELFDLAEAKALFGQTYFEDLEPDWKNILLRKLDLLKNTGFGFAGVEVPHLEEITDVVLDNMQFISQEERLPLTEDNQLTFVPSEGCQIEQAATFVNDSLVKFDERIWNALSTPSKAALVLHEILYRIDRNYKKAADSSRVRRVIAVVFENEETISDIRAPLSENYILCNTSSNSTSWNFHNLTAFAVVKKEDSLQIHFFVVGGDPIVTSSIAKASPENISMFESPLIGDYQELSLTADSTFEGGDQILLKAVMRDEKLELQLEGYRPSIDREIGKTRVFCRKVGSP